MKQCNKCNQQKPLTDFPTNGMRKGNLVYRGMCKPCYRIRLTELESPEQKIERLAKSKIKRAERYKQDAIYYRRKNWKTRGIDIESAELAIANNDGTCDICKEKATKTLHLDHCHTTNKVRGLLCDSCNHLLGKAKDSQRILVAAIDYLNNRN